MVQLKAFWKEILFFVWNLIFLCFNDRVRETFETFQTIMYFIGFRGWTQSKTQLDFIRSGNVLSVNWEKRGKKICNKIEFFTNISFVCIWFEMQDKNHLKNIKSIPNTFWKWFYEIYLKFMANESSEWVFKQSIQLFWRQLTFKREGFLSNNTKYVFVCIIIQFNKYD